MRRAFAVSGAFALALLSFAQQPAAPQAAPPGKQALKEVEVPDGVRIHVVLKTDLDSNSSRAGDPVVLEAIEDARDEKRVVLIPKKATLKGRVSEVVQWTKDRKESRLSIIVESAEWKDGHAPLRAFISGQLQIGGAQTSLEIRKVADIPLSGPAPTIVNLPPPSPSPSKPAVQLRVAADPQIGSELVSNEKSIALPAGTSFVVKNWIQ